MFQRFYMFQLTYALGRAAGDKMLLTNRAECYLAALLRIHSRMNDYIFHGTSLASKILQTDQLRYARIGDPVISFTRCADTAAHFAALPKTGDDGIATVFMFNRRALRNRYRLEPFCDEEWVPSPSWREKEERIVLTDVACVSRYVEKVVVCAGGYAFVTESVASAMRVIRPMAEIIHDSRADLGEEHQRYRDGAVRKGS